MTHKEEGKISAKDIEGEEKKLRKRNLGMKQILREVYDRITPVDFRKEAELDDKDRVKKTDFVVIVVDFVLKIARSLGYNIGVIFSEVHLYNKAFWEKVDPDYFKRFLGICGKKMGMRDTEARHYGAKEDLYKQVLSEAHEKDKESGSNSVLLNLQNGTIEITPERQFLRGFRAEDMLTYQLPFEYDPEAKCPLFDRYLNEVLPDIESQNVIAEYLGSVFIGNETLKLEKALMLLGFGANGKSVLYEIVTALFGEENVTHFPIDKLTDGTGYSRAVFAGKLLNYSSELSNKIYSDRFKQLVSGEPMEARLPYGNPFQIKNYPKLIINANELPRVDEHTEGYYRRFQIIPFNVNIPEGRQDKELANKIISTELSGVFNWVLEGLKRLLENKRLSPCRASEIALERYKKEADNIGLFLEEKSYKSDPVDFEYEKSLYEKYQRFCMADGYRPVSKATFRKRLEAKDIRIQRVKDGSRKVYITHVDYTEFPF